jgi:hypothetical protein
VTLRAAHLPWRQRAIRDQAWLAANVGVNAEGVGCMFGRTAPPSVTLRGAQAVTRGSEAAARVLRVLATLL